MNKAIIFSDWHLHNYRRFNKGGVRLKNCIKVAYDIAAYARANRIKIILFGGDWYDQQKEIPTEVVNASVDMVKEISKDYPELVWVMISGNHDYATKNLFHSPAITALQHITKVSDNFALIDNKYAEFKNTLVYGIPYYELKEDYNLALDAAVRNVTEFQSAMDVKRKTILMIHQTPEFITNKMIKGDTDPYDARYELFDYVYCGHIHLRQDLTKNFTVIGSPLHRDAADEGQQKGFLVFDMDAPEKGYEFVYLKGYPEFKSVVEGSKEAEAIIESDFVNVKPDMAQLRLATSVHADRFNTGLKPTQLVHNYWEEANGKDEELLRVGLSFLDVNN